MLRAEALTLSNAPADPASCSVAGTVADVRFAGAVVSYRIDLGDHELTVTRPPRAELLAEGEAVTVSWNPRDSLLLSVDEERTS